MKKYIFTEHNDNEGEIWKVFFRATDQQLETIQKINNIAGSNCEIYDCDLPDSSIDYIIDFKNGINESGYYNLFQRLEIRTDLNFIANHIADECDYQKKIDLATDYLYKLGIFQK